MEMEITHKIKNGNGNGNEWKLAEWKWEGVY